MPDRSSKHVSMRRFVTPTRDWRMAALGGSCTTLGAACVLLAACTTNSVKPHIATTPTPTPTANNAPAAAPAAPVSAAPAAAVSPWVALRARFALSDCDYNAAVLHWARWYTEDASGFELSLRQSLPFMLIVADHLAQHDMPGEFAFLPYLESNYTPLSSSGDRAAGIWQLMPDTAREAGLRIARGYDGRLDILASTNAALTLLAHYHDLFDDWRLADMAFNAGEYAVRQRFDSAHAPYTVAEIDHLSLPRGAHDHLAKLLALACIVRDPARFDVQLPEPEASDRLVEAEFAAPLDLLLAARLAGVDATRLHQLNPGYRNGRMPAAGPFHLLLPPAGRDALTAALNQLPQALWANWYAIVLHQPETVALLASANNLDAQTLAVANGLPADAQLAAGARLLLPGRAASESVATTTESTTHTVRTGDTLWRIAHDAHVALEDLRRWNGLDADARLHIGQRLRLQAPDANAAAAAVAASAN